MYSHLFGHLNGGDSEVVINVQPASRSLCESSGLVASSCSAYRKWPQYSSRECLLLVNKVENTSVLTHFRLRVVGL
jgi:hypothetical protein